MIHTDLSKQYIKELLPANPIIIEAGAHKGRDTVKLAKYMPDSTIYAFEPIPALFSQLQEATKNYPQITCYNLALGKTTGTTTIHVSAGSSDAASSLLKPELYLSERPGILFSKQIISTITLDEWARAHNIQKIDFMWLDMQGFEYAALSAGTEILKTISLIYTEINYTQRYSGHPLFPEYKNWLESQGFTLIGEEKKKETWGNALFQRK